MYSLEVSAFEIVDNRSEFKLIFIGLGGIGGGADDWLSDKSWVSLESLFCLLVLSNGFTIIVSKPFISLRQNGHKDKGFVLCWF